jgi:hypothetical protein
MRRLPVAAVLVGLFVTFVLVGQPVPGTSASSSVGFSQPRYIDTSLAGGEPLIMNTGWQGTLIYSSHQGSTHLYRSGLPSFGSAQFAANDRDQVYVWTSSNDGSTWKLDSTYGTGVTSPYANGFSDPDLTQDEGGTVYDTGINLANDSVFASNDGGYTWLQGNPDCHDGDRPWLAGGKAGTVYMATDTLEGTLSHEVFQGTRTAAGQILCSTTGVPDTDGKTYSGDGKLYYDHHNGNLIEPAEFFDANGNINGVGVSVASAYGRPFVPHRAAYTTMYAHWPAIAIDAADNIYVVWDTDPRDTRSMTGCPDANGNPQGKVLPNSIMGAVSRDHGKTWQVFTVAHPGNVRVLWPWVAAGDAGKISVVWYQLDRLADSDCQPARTYVYDANISSAQLGRSSMAITITNASGRSIHDGSICQGGTDCVATGQDRRLGDYFTNALDQRGCVIIATGDTMLRDAVTGGDLPTARPVFIKQNAGTSLVGNRSCSYQ